MTKEPTVELEITKADATTILEALYLQSRTLTDKGKELDALARKFMDVRDGKA